MREVHVILHVLRDFHPGFLSKKGSLISSPQALGPIENLHFFVPQFTPSGKRSFKHLIDLALMDKLN